MTMTAPMTSSAHAPASPPRPRLTPEDFARFDDEGKLFELVDGEPLEKPVSDVAHLIAQNLNDEVTVWAHPTKAGRSFVEAPFQCFAHAPEMVRRPDLAYASRERLDGYQWGQPYLRFVPDLTVEVVSPGDNVFDLDRKIADHFRAGVRRVWVINYDQRAVRVHRAPGDLSELIGDGTLADDAVLPGFRCALPALFAVPGLATPAT